MIDSSYIMRDDPDPICCACGQPLLEVLHYTCVVCTNYFLCRGCRVSRLQKKLHLEHSFRPICSTGKPLDILIYHVTILKIMEYCNMIIDKITPN